MGQRAILAPAGVSGLTNYDYGFRIYNPAIGRFLSVDPLRKEYPWYTPYQFAGNRPIGCIDLDGLEPVDVTFLASNSRPFPKLRQSEWYVIRAKAEETSYRAAFKYNIENDNPGAYQTIEIRNNWYKWAAKETKPQGNYWFAAADKVTSWWAVGSADLVNLWFVRNPAEDLLRKANEFLLRENFKNFGAYALGQGSVTWTNPVTHKPESFGHLSGAELDDQMVVIEMTTLQGFLDKYKDEYIGKYGQNAWENVADNLNSLFQSVFLKYGAVILGADSDSNNYGQGEFGKKFSVDFDFMNLQHRIFQGQKMAEYIRSEDETKD